MAHFTARGIKFQPSFPLALSELYSVQKTRRTAMRRLTLLLTAAIAALAPLVLAQPTGPYKVLKTAKVGGEGGTDYIYADTVGRRLYITRGATQAREATATTPAVPPFEKRLTIFDLDTRETV